LKGEEDKGAKISCGNCGLGKYGSSKGKCSSCPLGQYKDGKGESSCKECEVDTYLTESGKASKADCTFCSTTRSTGFLTGNTNASACLCRRGTYYQTATGACQPCPMGADCSVHDGSTLSQLTSLPGFWRANATTTLFTNCKVAFSSSLDPEAKAKERCPGGSNSSTVNQSSAVFDPNSQCKNIPNKEGYGGPSCMACLNKGYTLSNDKCIRCEGGASFSSVMGLVMGIMGIFFILFAIVFMRVRVDENKKPNRKKTQTKKQLVRKQTKEEKIQSQRGNDAAGRLIGDQVMIGRVQGVGGGGPNSDDARSQNAGEPTFRSDSQVVIDRVKILYGWMQIFTSITFTFDIQWPIQLRRFSLGLNFINLDFGNMLGDSACSFSLSFLDQMVVQTIFPLLLLFTIVLARIPAWCVRQQLRQQQQAMQIKLISALALILYPGLCTRLFSSLKVVTVSGLRSEGVHSGRVLAVDYSVEAFGTHHMPYVYFAIAGMVIFVLGIPVSVFFALRSNKKYLYSAVGSSKEHRRMHNDVVDEFGTLYLQYERRYWYWEVIVILKKMVLTGAMTIIAPGSSAQLLIALLIVLVNLLLVLKLAPFVDDADGKILLLLVLLVLLVLSYLIHMMNVY